MISEGQYLEVHYESGNDMENKKNGNWVLVAVPSPEGSEEEVEEVEKLTQKLRKYGEISD